MLMPIQKSRFELESQGCRLRGFILKPEAAEPIPAVIVSHGFASCTRDTKKYAQVLVEEGYAAVCFDFCMSGSGRSSGSSLGMSVLTEKTDLLNVLDYVKTLDFVDPARIILAGCSQGGLVSALAAAEREADVEQLILDVMDMDPFREICGFPKPVLIVHGTKDRLVDIRYSRRACECYPNCGLVEVNGGHGFIFGGFARSRQATLEYLHTGKGG